MRVNERKLFKVGSKTDSMHLSIGIIAELKKESEMDIAFVGSSASFISSKALAIANSKLAVEGKQILVTHVFENDDEVEDSKVVPIKLKLKLDN